MTFAKKILVLLLCLPSGAILLLHVLGLSTMRSSGLWLFLPTAALFLILLLKKSILSTNLKKAITFGIWGGLLGTLGYDLIRIPFALMGLKVFFPISVYGMWITDASQSGFFTELIAWTYHFSNGITFGIMYALFMKNRHWFWAVIWAFVLESIAVLSPFSDIFGLTSNYTALGIAYLGHVAYGIPLGWVVMKSIRPPVSTKWIKKVGVAGLILFFVLIITIPQFPLQEDKTFLIDKSNTVSPTIFRRQVHEEISIYNVSDAIVSIHSPILKEPIELNPNMRQLLSLDTVGIYMLEIKVPTGTTSSFVIVEPVVKQLTNKIKSHETY